MAETAEPTRSTALALSLDVDETKAELAVPDTTDDDELTEKARGFADQLLAFDPTDENARAAGRAAIDEMGRELQREAGERSRMLQAPIRELSHGTEDGGPVAKSLVDLRIQVEELDPVGVDLEPGGLMRMLGNIPGIGTPLKRYFSRYQKAQTVIDSIIRSLEQGRDQLGRDNVTLGEDQGNMRELTLKLNRQVALAGALDQQLGLKLDEIGGDDPRRGFVEEELLFPLRQRTMDLQQQLAVNQQGVLATEIIIRNNRELIRGVDRAIDVTVSALQVAVTVALALAHQRIVLDKINAVNETTSDLIAGTAERLKTQGTEIHEQASSTMLDMESLKGAFADINAALDEISRYRREALPKMAASIVELDELTADGEEAMRRLESAREAREATPLLDIEAGD